MIQNQTTNKEQKLRQIADMLLLNGTITDCPGLIHGKAGIAIGYKQTALNRRLLPIYISPVCVRGRRVP